MSEYSPEHFKQHLKKIIGYLDDITNKLNTALDSYLLAEKKTTEKDIKHYKSKRGKKK